MVLRRTGLDDLPLLVVLVLSTTLLVWAGLGTGRGGGVVFADGARGDSSETDRTAAPEFDGLDVTDGRTWMELAQTLALRALSIERRLAAPISAAASDISPSLPGPHPEGGELGAAAADQPVLCYDADGNPLLHGWMRDGKPVDRWTVWHEGGARFFTGRFVDGVPDGAWAWWHENGELRAEGAFLSGDAEGLWREWYPSGARAALLEYRDGQRHGANEEWWPEGEPKTHGRYEQGERDGYWESWYQNGQLRAQGEYRHGLRHGEWREYHDNGTTLLEASYDRSRPQGEWREWYRNGQIKSRGWFVDGRREGPWEFYDYDGTVDPRSGTYDGGERVRN